MPPARRAEVREPDRRRCYPEPSKSQVTPSSAAFVLADLDDDRVDLHLQARMSIFWFTTAIMS